MHKINIYNTLFKVRKFERIGYYSKLYYSQFLLNLSITLRYSKFFIYALKIILNTCTLRKSIKQIYSFSLTILKLKKSKLVIYIFTVISCSFLVHIF